MSRAEGDDAETRGVVSQRRGTVIVSGQPVTMWRVRGRVFPEGPGDLEELLFMAHDMTHGLVFAYIQYRTGYMQGLSMVSKADSI